ncbi:MAG: hypothetical protein JWQ27_1415 [Ferruginibacter sp.]|nr:hypothetical protein [Ferruginibacter sp.]
MRPADLFSILNSVDSTNNYAMRKVHAGLAKHGMAWFAHEQTAGKGQRGKTWQTGHRQNIALSIVLYPQGLSLVQSFQLSVAVSLACHRFLSQFAGDDCFIKWPNDIYWRDRKAGGILIENQVQGEEWKFAVAGIGFNVNQESFRQGMKNPVSLHQVTRKMYDTVTLAHQIYEMVLEEVEKIGSVPFAEKLTEYNSKLYGRGRKMKMRHENRVFETEVKEVIENGKLITGSHGENAFEFGSVEWL